MNTMEFVDLKKTSFLLVLLSLLGGCVGLDKTFRVNYVEANGVSSNCEQAIQNAKQAAVEQVTGSLLQARRAVVGSDFSESISEFSGGTVKKSEVLSIRQGELCYVRIAAEVEPGNLKVSEAAPQLAFDLDQIKVKTRKMEESRKQLAALIDRPELIQLGFNHLDWSLDHAGHTKISYQLTEMKPSERWYLELEDFFKVQGIAVQYRQISGRGSLFSFFTKSDRVSQRYESVQSGSQDSEICFGSNTYNEIRCYQSSVADVAMKMLDNLQLNQVVTNAAGKEISRTVVKPTGLSLYVRKGFSEKYSSDQGTSHVFNLIQSEELPISVSSTIKDVDMSGGSRLNIALSFKTQK